MPVVLRFKNLKFCIYTDDHGNAHVHVIGPGAEAKIYLRDREVVLSRGFSKKALGQIVLKVEEFEDLLMDAWEWYHGEKED